MKIFFKGLNPCAARRVNLLQYKDYLVEKGYEVTDIPQEADYILIWGCGFRTDYRNNSISQAKYYEELLGEKGEVILGGCIPDIDPNFIEQNWGEKKKILPWAKDYREIDKIFPQLGKISLENTKMKLVKQRLCKNANQYKIDHPDKDACYLDEHIQVYVSEGCRLTCSYCSEKLMFPEYNSYPMNQILEETKIVVEEFKGLYPEEEVIPIMLQADSVGDYGKDIGTTLPQLLENIIQMDNKIKIGLQGFNPAHFIEYEKEFIDLIRRDKILHLRLPIQNGNDMILKNMGRKYNVKDICRMFEIFINENFKSFSTDIIIGFPGETEETYCETINLILKYKPQYILLSAYMDFERLPSFQLADKVCQEVKLKRLKKASDIFIENGIYCSTDGGSMTDERRKRLNSDYRI